MKQKMRDMELDIQNYKKWCAESESSAKNLKHQFESVQSERNILSRNLLTAKVSYVSK